MGMGVAASAGAQTATDLQRSLVQAHWFPAHQAYQATPFQVSIPVLRQMANDNYVIAQWFLADALAHQGQDEEATAWLYTASLGTRMDASLCKMRTSQHVEYRFLDVFRPQFDRIRKHEKNRYNALQKAAKVERGVQQQGLTHQLGAHVPAPAKIPLAGAAYALHLAELAADDVTVLQSVGRFALQLENAFAAVLAFYGKDFIHRGVQGRQMMTTGRVWFAEK